MSQVNLEDTQAKQFLMSPTNGGAALYRRAKPEGRALLIRSIWFFASRGSRWVGAVSALLSAAPVHRGLRGHASEVVA